MSFLIAGSVTPRENPLFVLRPSDPLGNHDNVFTNWDDLMVEANKANSPGTVVFDFAHATRCQITSSASEPGGKWIMVGWTWRATAREFDRKVEFLEGAAFETNLPGSDFLDTPAMFMRDMWLENVGTQHVFDHDDAGSGSLANIYLQRVTIESDTGAGSVFHGQTDQVNLDCVSVDFINGGAVCVSGSNAVITLRGNCSIAASAVGSISTINDHGGAGHNDVDESIVPTNRNADNSAPWGTREDFGGPYTAPAAVGVIFGGGRHIIRYDTSGGAIAQPLPPAVSAYFGREVVLSKTTTDGNALSATPDAGGDTIVGPASTSTSQGLIHLVCNGDGSWTTLSTR